MCTKTFVFVALQRELYSLNPHNISGKMDVSGGIPFQPPKEGGPFSQPRFEFTGEEVKTREQLRKDIIETMKSGQSVILYGLVKSGKSMHMGNPIAKELDAGLVDLMQFSSQQFRDLVNDPMKCYKDRVGARHYKKEYDREYGKGDFLVIDDLETRDLSEFGEEDYQKIFALSKQRPLLLLIQFIASDKDFFREKFEEKGFKPVYLSLAATEDEAEEFINKERMRVTGCSEVTEDAMSFIMKASARRVGDIWTILQETVTSESIGVPLTKEMVSEALDKLGHENIICSHMYAPWFRNLGETHRSVLRKILADKIGDITDEDSEALRDLKKLGVVTQDLNPGSIMKKLFKEASNEFSKFCSISPDKPLSEQVAVFKEVHKKKAGFLDALGYFQDLGE